MRDHWVGICSSLVLVAIFFSILIGMVFVVCPSIEADGYRAFNDGVPAVANPYQGGNYATFAPLWLQGWVKAKRESESK